MQNMTRTKKWIYICLSINLVFVSRRFESFAGHSGSGGDRRRKSFELVSSFLVLKLLFYSFSHPPTYTYTHFTHMAAHRYTTTSQRFLCLLLPFHTWKQQGFSMKTIVVHGPSIGTCCILKRLEILQFFSPSTPAEVAALLYCMPVLLLEADY